MPSLCGFDYNSPRWRRKRAKIVKRDGYHCCECARYGRRNTTATTVHHKLPVETHPQLAYDDNNLESLCNACHNKRHPEKGGGRVGKRSRYPPTSHRA